MQTKALTASLYGQPDVLQFTTFDLPSPDIGTAVIEVKTAGVNPVDARRMTGELRYGSLPLFFGTEFAGTIVALGGSAGDWQIGDEVLGSGGDFTHATFIQVPIANLVRKPANVTWEAAGSLPGVAQTAATILEELGAISSLLIHGGAGGVGTLTIQLARQAGIDVVVTCSETNQDYIRSLGATPVVYGTGLLQQLTQQHALFDASVDMAGSDEAFQVSLARVKAHGVIASIVAAPDTPARVTQIWRRRDPQLVQRVVSAVSTGQLTWHVSRAYPFHQARAAYEAILARHVRGKSVLTFYEETENRIMKKLEGKIALITGGSSGIGLATAQLFVAEGAYVFITGRRQEELDAAVQLIGHQVTGVQGDVANLADLDRLYEQVRQQKGHLDIVFANAGGSNGLVPLGAITEEHFDKVFNMNVRGLLFTVQKALPLLRDGSSIILTASTTGTKGAAAFSVYSASKAAVRSFARTWTMDLQARKIRVNALSPGPTETPGLTRMGDTPAQKQFIKDYIVANVPLGRLGKPEETAKAAVFLASDDSSFITGIELFVDGGVAQI
jgi:NAD(P)-dependent dehydrogenase (short-subunit alcohol dehydrogenase family)/Zn-dependent alcohol dehydrogenase